MMLPALRALMMTALALAPPRGRVQITSRTQGAEVSVDGEVVGTIPLEHPIVLPTGQHTVKLRKRGYTEFLDVVVVRDRKVTPVDVDLLPVSGVLRVRASVAGARVFVDGQFVGETGSTPLEADLAVGLRSLRVEKGGYRDFLHGVRSVAGEVSEVQADLTELPAPQNPFRPQPTAALWYDHWYVWAGAAAVVVALTAAIVIPAAVGGGDPCQGADLCFRGVGR
jgi:hypothetical protein